ncbi:MAG: homoserine dehydrogenase, partial [Gemmatimonadota bacterium]|nr:homoserine dehydrogenase [Gemmatimonadota bacterium]
SAVMDGAPVFSLVRHCLPLAGLRGVRGVFTSTATVVLEAIEEGLSIDDGIARAQQLGIAEADPSYDVDGWDSAVKLCAVANVLLDASIVPATVDREGIRSLDAAMVRKARRDGRPFRLIGRVARESASVTARVAPEQIAPDDPLGLVRGTTLAMHYDADVFPGGLTIVSHDPDPTTTAFGLLADFLSVARAV